MYSIGFDFKAGHPTRDGIGLDGGFGWWFGWRFRWCRCWRFRWWRL